MAAGALGCPAPLYITPGRLLKKASSGESPALVTAALVCLHLSKGCGGRGLAAREASRGVFPAFSPAVEGLWIRPGTAWGLPEEIRVGAGYSLLLGAAC